MSALYSLISNCENMRPLGYNDKCTTYRYINRLKHSGNHRYHINFSERSGNYVPPTATLTL